MAITGLFAHLSCTDPDRGTAWYATLFDRPPDARPMAGLVEWHLGGGGFQLFRDADAAGHGTLTVMVDDLAGERARIACLDPGEIEQATAVRIVRLRDPDGNLVVLVGAG